ncbi:putative cell adhesion molecule 3-like [Scophthalmus maximus]|uniref:Putative cell adhesion molecule 3-like n=1 Tax=Scophthalmus maximus TaxID=52904 RepID=A0A2U9CTY0_SCOMX|nr:putative cell adhesion molecule 3-like [Scophthalmus maximus]
MMWLFVLGGLIASTGSPVSARCQIELSPPKVVVEYGDPFSVNCSSSSDHIEGMGWESPEGGTGFMNGVSSLPLDVDSIALWSINAQCYVTLSDGQQCTERLPVTVYKTPDSVSMPQPSPTGPMVEGQKYRVQCAVAEVAPARHLVVQWHKGDEIFSVDEFNVSSVSPLNVSSVRELTAHRDDSGTRIWCEAMLNFLPAGPQLPPMQSKSHEVIVLLSGEGCSLILKPSRVVVGFGEPVSVSCEAARPVRVLGWESAISASHTQQDLSVQWKVDSLIDWIEEPICYGVFFTAPRQCEEKLNLVLYKTPDSVSIRPVNHTGPMVEGKEYQLLCEVQNIAPVQYLTLRWYREKTEVYNHSFSDLTSSSPVQVSSILLVTPTKAENGAQYRCVAELELGPEGPQPPPTVASEPLNASVYFPPTFLSPEPEVVDLTVGAEISLNCRAAGNPTPVYSWQSPHPTQETMENEAVLTSSSLLPGTYTCTASNALEKKSKQFIVKAKTKGV